MTISEILGILGFILALFCLGWQMWSQHTQTRERVRAKILLQSKPCVQVHNTGLVPVHLTGAELVVVSSKGITKKYPLQAMCAHRCLPQEAGRLSEEIWQFLGEPTYDEPLPPGGAYRFALPKEAAPLNELVVNAKKSKMWISFYSNGGELYRLRKKQALAYVGELVKAD